MTVILIIEILSALIACGALAVLVFRALRATSGDGIARNHKVPGAALVIAGCAHGLAAMAYGSGARVEAYIAGWMSVALFSLSALCMLPAVRRKLRLATLAHTSIFVIGILFLIIHIVLGRQ